MNNLSFLVLIPCVPFFRTKVYQEKLTVEYIIVVAVVLLVRLVPLPMAIGELMLVSTKPLVS